MAIQTTIHHTGTVPQGEVGAHSSGGAIQTMQNMVNACAAQMVTVMASIEAAEKAENAMTMAGAMANDLQAGMMKSHPMTDSLLSQNSVSNAIDLGKDSMRTINGKMKTGASTFDRQMKDMQKAPAGFVRNAPQSGTMQSGKASIRSGTNVTRALTGSKLDVTSNALAGESNMRPKADGGNLKGGKSYSAAQSLGIQRGPSPAAPALAAAPVMGLGGGGKHSRGGNVQMARNSIDVNAPKQLIGQIQREVSLRGDTPGDKTRAEWEGEKARKIRMEGFTEQQLASNPVAGTKAKNPYFMDLNMGMNGPKGPSGSLLSGSDDGGMDA